MARPNNADLATTEPLTGDMAGAAAPQILVRQRHAIAHGAAKQLWRAMHGAVGVRMWQRPAPLVAGVAGLAAPPIRTRL